MTSFINQTSFVPKSGRSIAIAALLGATMLASPLYPAHAESPASGPMRMAQAATPQAVMPPSGTPAAAAPQSRSAAGAIDTKGETVEQRIGNLHTALKITTDQEAAWRGVAQAMRENATNMDKLIAASRATPPKNLNAVEDLEAYQKFAQAHVDGLKNLISSFRTLYTAMPEAQRKVADDVFNAPGPAATPTRG